MTSFVAHALPFRGFERRKLAAPRSKLRQFGLRQFGLRQFGLRQFGLRQFGLRHGLLKLGCTSGIWLGLTLSTLAQTTSPRPFPTIRPVPLPPRSEAASPRGSTNPALTELMPSEQALLEQFAPGSSSGFGPSDGSAPSTGPLRVPELRVPVGNAGSRGDVSSFTLAQMPWNTGESPDIGGGGPEVRPSPALQVLPQVQNLWPSYPSRNLPSNWPMQPPTTQPPPSQTPPSPTPQWRYRVFVVAPLDAAQTAQLQAQLRAWVPDVFTVQGRGQNVLQLGSFGDRNRATQLMQQLQRLGLWPQMEVTVENR